MKIVWYNPTVHINPIKLRFKHIPTHIVDAYGGVGSSHGVHQLANNYLPKKIKKCKQLIYQKKKKRYTKKKSCKQCLQDHLC